MRADHIYYNKLQEAAITFFLPWFPLYIYSSVLFISLDYYEVMLEFGAPAAPLKMSSEMLLVIFIGVHINSTSRLSQQVWRFILCHSSNL